LLLLCMHTANAQHTKGNWLVGGSGSYSSDRQSCGHESIKQEVIA